MHVPSIMSALISSTVSSIISLIKSSLILSMNDRTIQVGRTIDGELVNKKIVKIH